MGWSYHSYCLFNKIRLAVSKVPLDTADMSHNNHGHSHDSMSLTQTCLQNRTPLSIWRKSGLAARAAIKWDVTASFWGEQSVSRVFLKIFTLLLFAIKTDNLLKIQRLKISHFGEDMLPSSSSSAGQCDTLITLFSSPSKNKQACMLNFTQKRNDLPNSTHLVINWIWTYHNFWIEHIPF